MIFSRSSTAHGGGDITTVLHGATMRTVHVVLSPEEAHLVGTVPEHCRGGARPQPPGALLPHDGSCAVQWPLHRATHGSKP